MYEVFKDAPIDSTLEFEDKTVKVVEDIKDNEEETCKGCIFKVSSRLCPANPADYHPYCDSSTREDKLPVKFVEVTKDILGSEAEPLAKDVVNTIQVPKKFSVGKKFDAGKLRYTLLPFKALTEVVKVLEFGAKKYGVDNWQKVDNAKQRYIDACFRHLVASQDELLDDESKLPHLAHAVCCLLFVLWLELN